MSYCSICNSSPCRCGNHAGQLVTPMGGQHLHVHGAVQAPSAFTGSSASTAGNSDSVASVYLQVVGTVRIPKVGATGDLQTNIPAPPAGTRMLIPGRGVIEVIAAHGTHVTFRNISIQAGDGYDGHHVGDGAMLQIVGADGGGVVEVNSDADLGEALNGIAGGQLFLYQETDAFGNKVCRLGLRISKCSDCDIAGTGFLPIPLGTTGPVWADSQTRIAFTDQTTTDENAAQDGVQQSGSVTLASLGITPAPGATAHQMLITPDEATGAVVINGQQVANFTSPSSSPVFVTVPINASGTLSYEISLTNTGTIEIQHIGDVI